MNLALRMQSNTKQEETLSWQNPSSLCSSFLLVFQDFAAETVLCSSAAGVPSLSPIWGFAGANPGSAGIPLHRSVGVSGAMLRGTSRDWS